MNQPTLTQDSPAWLAFVWISFVLALLFMAAGIYWVPVDPWIRGYLAIGLLFAVGSSFSLAKTVRDRHETEKLVNRISEVKTERLLQDFELKS
jgi:hypothetical protein